MRITAATSTGAPGIRRLLDDPVERLTLLSLIGLTILGAALRWISIDSRGLWLDEAVTVVQARRTIPLIIETVAQGVHPPLFHILMHFWVTVFGVSEAAVRSYASVWGTLSIPAAYWAARSFYDRRSGLIAALIVSVSPYLIWFSQEARMYSMQLFFAFLSLGFLKLACRHNRPRYWVGYALATALGMFTHYFFAFLVLGQGLYFVIVEVLVVHTRLRREGRAISSWRRPWRLFEEIPKLGPWLMCVAFIGVLYGVWLSRSVFLGDGNPLLVSAGGGGLGYGQVAPEWRLRFAEVGTIVIEMMFGFHPLWLTTAVVAMWPVVIYAVLALLDYMEFLARRSTIALWATIGLVVLAVLGQWQGQALASRYYISLAAPMVILVGGVLGAMATGRRRGFLIVGVLISIAAWGSQSYNPQTTVRFEYREALNTIVDQSQPGDVVIYEPLYLDPVMLYYVPPEIPAYPFPQYTAEGDERRAPAEIRADLERTVGPAQRVWVALGFREIPVVNEDAINTLAWFEDEGFALSATYEFNRMQVYLFERMYDTRAPVDLLEVTP